MLKRSKAPQRKGDYYMYLIPSIIPDTYHLIMYVCEA
jgi:hypothetical protein